MSGIEFARKRPEPVSGLWNSGRAPDKTELLRRVRIYTLGDAKIWKPVDRVRYGKYWKGQHDELREAVDEAGLDVLGEEDLRSYKLMQDFATKVGDILERTPIIPYHIRRL